MAGACLGALVFGQLTDRYGRKKLFLVTLGVYLAATVATAFSFDAWYFFLCRFVTGMGIGGEYAAIKSAIDELIPARNRGQVDIAINGSFWVGAGLGALASVFLLETSIFESDFGWRLAFGMGAILGLGILLVRRNIPESPRWLFIHGREDEAERIVRQIEEEVRRETSEDLPAPREAITVRQREAIPFREIASVLIRRCPRRAVLGLALFVGQAFLDNAVTFDLGTILSEFFEVSSEKVPYLFVVFAAGNFLGPLLLGRLFDTVGRVPMIAGTYLASSAMVFVLGFLLRGESLETWSFMVLIAVTFFFASAGASSAYLTVSEVFPMETRALAIAFFYAVGTATASGARCARRCARGARRGVRTAPTRRRAQAARSGRATPSPDERPSRARAGAGDRDPLPARERGPPAVARVTGAGSGTAAASRPDSARASSPAG